MSDKFSELGIPQGDITPAVSIAISGLLEHIEQMNSAILELSRQLEKMQGLVDVEVSPAIPNRNAFVNKLNWSTAMFKRHNQPITCAIFRINNFDDIEGSYGISAGSTAISHSANLLTQGLRDTDFLARISRNEFGCIMFFADYENARRKCRDLCNLMIGHPLGWNNKAVDISLSFGAHLITSGDNAEKAILAARNALHVEDKR